MQLLSPHDHHHHLELDDALEFLNTHELESGHLVDRLESPADAESWFVGRGVVHEPAQPWDQADLEHVRRVRDSLREVVDSLVDGRAPSPDAVTTVNAALDAGPAPRLEIVDGAVEVGHHHAAGCVDDALFALAQPIVDEVAHGRPGRFRTCANDTCRWTFFDTSPTGRRRWCDMKTCGNRAKAARHRERVRAETQAETPPESRSAARPSADA